MRDIPVFTTGAGVASLILKEIPYKSAAYIKLQDSCDPETFLQECLDFCRAVGAKHVYAAGSPVLEKYPFHTAIWKMSCLRSELPQTDASLVPVQRTTLEQWRTIYNERMHTVPNSSTMTLADAEKMLSRGEAYFICKDDTLLGIGIASGEQINAVIAVISGAGQDVLLALTRALSAEWVTIEVASENTRAISLYKRLGFRLAEEISRWYQLA